MLYERVTILGVKKITSITSASPKSFIGAVRRASRVSITLSRQSSEGYPGTYPSIITPTRFGTRVLGYLQEYAQKKQVLELVPGCSGTYRSMPNTTRSSIPGYLLCTFLDTFFTASYLQDLNLEVVDRRRVTFATGVDRFSRQYRRCTHVVREHLYQEVHVAELGGQSRSDDIVGARHDLVVPDKS